MATTQFATQLINSIAAGYLDDDLREVNDAVIARHREIRRQERAADTRDSYGTAAHAARPPFVATQVEPGDYVRFNVDARPAWVAGRVARVVRVSNRTVVLDHMDGQPTTKQFRAYRDQFIRLDAQNTINWRGATTGRVEGNTTNASNAPQATRRRLRQPGTPAQIMNALRRGQAGAGISTRDLPDVTPEQSYEARIAARRVTQDHEAVYHPGSFATKLAQAASKPVTRPRQRRAIE